MTQLEKRRKAKGLRQEDVAQACGVDRTTVTKWEAGLFLPRADKLPALAKLLGCTVDKLLSKDKDAKSMKNKNKLLRK